MSLRDRIAQAVREDLGWTDEGRERKAKETAERRQRVELDAARKANTFAGIYLNGDVVESSQGGGPVKGARAYVESAGNISQRATLPRVLLTGPFAFGIPKDFDHRELYLLIEGEGWGVSVKVPPDQGAQAREFMMKVNAAAGR